MTYKNYQNVSENLPLFAWLYLGKNSNSRCFSTLLLKILSYFPVRKITQKAGLCPLPLRIRQLSSSACNLWRWRVWQRRSKQRRGGNKKRQEESRRNIRGQRLSGRSRRRRRMKPGRRQIWSRRKQAGQRQQERERQWWKVKTR